LLLGANIWPGVFLGAFLVNVTISGAVAPSLGIACGNTLEAFVGAWLVMRYAHGRHAFDRAADIFRFTLLAGLLSPTLSATVGVTSLVWGGLARWADYGAIWWTWWLGDAMGALLVTPLVLSWSTTQHRPWRRSEFGEAVLVFLAVVSLGLLVFAGLLPRGPQQPLAFLVVPLLAWMAFRLSQREVTTTVAVLASLALWGTLHGFGPFARTAPNVALLLLQTFMGVMAVTTTIVAAVVAELKQATATVVQLNQELEQRVQERTTDLATANAALRHEMTERQHAEAERRRLEFEAQRAEHFALLGRLAAGVSHEIRNPLGAIFLHVDLLEEELRVPSPDSPTQVAESLAEIKTHLVRLEDLVQDYLTLARVATIAQTPQDLGAAVVAWAAEWQTLAAAQGVTLRLVGITEVGQATFHVATLRRALLNLIQNALDAMPHGGILTLAGQGTATYVKLQVRDTGSGIPSEHLSQIFEPLFTTKPRGTGLGLYIVQEIVMAHGGRVTVESVVGHGTTFTITLPHAHAPGPS
jgi:signal transduction histidine kinase